MKKIISLIVFFALFIILIFSALEMRSFAHPEYTEMDDFFLEDSQDHSQVNNVVSAVLFDYRGLDTLGEATILFSAVYSLLIVLQKFESDRDWGGK